MKFKKASVLGLALAIALVLSLAACAALGPRNDGVTLAEQGAEPSDTPAPAPIGELPDGAAFLNGGMTLTVPAGYRDLVLVDMPQDDEYGTLFIVSERDSVNAAIDAGYDGEGAGWLFSIGRVNKAELDEMMTEDMSGAEVFAKDADGSYYMFYHPTDVRFFRAGDGYQNDQDGWAQWEKLNDWATNYARGSFIADNLTLTAYERTNTGVDIHLARLAAWDDIEYTISNTAFGPLAPDGVDAAPYIARLRDGVIFETTDEISDIDGERVVLYFPGDDIIFGFAGNYVRESYGPHDEYVILYKATYADGSTRVGDIMQAWYDALAVANGLLPTHDYPMPVEPEPGDAAVPERLTTP